MGQRGWDTHNDDHLFDALLAQRVVELLGQKGERLVINSQTPALHANEENQTKRLSGFCLTAVADGVEGLLTRVCGCRLQGTLLIRNTHPPRNTVGP